jgi:uncharacterized protein YodC (DUF2158 family)
MSELKKGEIVQLKSGGQIMTISKIGDYEGKCGIKEGALCVWFNKKGEAKEKVFDVSVLEAAPDDHVSVSINIGSEPDGSE